MAQQTRQPRVIAIVVFELREVSRRLRRRMREDFRARQLVTRIAIRRQRRELTLLIVTGEAHRVSRRTRFRIISLVTILALRIGVLIVRELDAKLGNDVGYTQTRKHVTRSIKRRRLHMTVRTNLRRRSLTREELLPMTVQTRCMLRKLSHIRKRRVAFTNFLPVLRRELVTRITRELLFRDVS